MGNPYAPPPPGPRTSGSRKRPHTGPPAGAPGPHGAGAPRDSGRTTDLPGGTEPSGRRPRPTEPLAIEVARALRRRLLLFSATTIGALLATSLPLPWQVLGGALSAAAVVLGVLTIRAVWRTPLRRSLLPVLVIGLAIATMYLTSSLAVVATWPIQVERQRCVERALTVSAREACEEQYRAALEERVSPGGPTPVP